MTPTTRGMRDAVDSGYYVVSKYSDIDEDENSD